MTTTDTSSLLNLLHRIMQIGAERFARELGGYDLTLRQLVILMAIASNEGASQTKLVELTGVDRSTLADVVSRLVSRRMIARKRSKLDSRAYLVTLTDEGRRAVDHAAPALAAVEAHLLSAIPKKQRADVLDLLGDVVAKC